MIKRNRVHICIFFFAVSLPPGNHNLIRLISLESGDVREFFYLFLFVFIMTAVTGNRACSNFLGFKTLMAADARIMGCVTDGPYTVLLYLFMAIRAGFFFPFNRVDLFCLFIVFMMTATAIILIRRIHALDLIGTVMNGMQRLVKADLFPGRRFGFPFNMTRSTFCRQRPCDFLYCFFLCMAGNTPLMVRRHGRFFTGSFKFKNKNLVFFNMTGRTFSIQRLSMQIMQKTDSRHFIFAQPRVKFDPDTIRSFIVVTVCIGLPNEGKQNG